MWSTTTTASAKSMWLVYHEWPNDWLSESVEVHPTPKRQNYPSHQFTVNGMNWSVGRWNRLMNGWMDGWFGLTFVYSNVFFCIQFWEPIKYTEEEHNFLFRTLNIQSDHISNFDILYYFFVEIFRRGLLTTGEDKCVSSNQMKFYPPKIPPFSFTV